MCLDVRKLFFRDKKARKLFFRNKKVRKLFFHDNIVRILKVVQVMQVKQTFTFGWNYETRVHEAQIHPCEALVTPCEAQVPPC